MAKFFALVPAAGAGARLGGALPKQYLPLAGRPMLHHALAALCAAPQIECVFVVLAPDDRDWERQDWSGLGGKLEALRCGGATRAASVLNGLRAATGVGDEDWVLVHDAARPCLGAPALGRLLAEAADDAVGGLLAVPVADTLKRDDGTARVAATAPRAGLWQAQTPQMFRRGLLLRALAQADGAVTDEAGAVEALGLKPRLVQGDPRNLKVTYAEDLALAELILGSAGRSTA